MNISEPSTFFGNTVVMLVNITTDSDNLRVLYHSNTSGSIWLQTSVVHIRSENTYVLDPSHAWTTDTQNGQLYNTTNGRIIWFPISTIAYNLQALSFANAWYGYAKHIRPDLVHEPLILPEQETEYTHQWAAFCAASVEFLYDRYSIPCPGWVDDPYYILETHWWRTKQEHKPAMKKRLFQITPTPFAHRNTCNLLIGVICHKTGRKIIDIVLLTAIHREKHLSQTSSDPFLFLF